jgi:hypothetical protein
VLSGADGLSSLAASVSTAAKLLEDQIDVVIANGVLFYIDCHHVAFLRTED